MLFSSVLFYDAPGPEGIADAVRGRALDRTARARRRLLPDCQVVNFTMSLCALNTCLWSERLVI